MQGRTFAFTGVECVAWCGSREGAGYSVQGNMLVGQPTIDAMAEAFEASVGKWLGIRLMAALEAGQAAGGDKRGRQSAALLVTPMDATKGPPPAVFDPRRYEMNIRVDEAPGPGGRAAPHLRPGPAHGPRAALAPRRAPADGVNGDAKRGT